MKTMKKFKMRLGKIALLLGVMMTFSATAFAHCDSYDGPVIQDAYKALEMKDATYVMKWIAPEHEAEIKQLFGKTIDLKNGDAKIYSIVEKHFLETLVRYHRETEGAPYTGLKPAGSTAPIVQMADNSIANKDVKRLLTALDKHIKTVVQEKYDKVMKLEKVKDNSVTEGRAYVAAYVDYTHTLEALETVLSHQSGHHH
ncbi:MAG TPA: DUF6448 family protein [Flavisolibacter sp.]|jgi:hypothetical protein|uniref:DUF6448 family protein n=1 Tax=Sphingobacterium sp. FBM7-1 TaxID=2886688 RepID=UPI001D0F853B|nr:DUF6448 family protein [Sphingobacterium sp. FBM7-1]MCC2600699.1 DUF6448 family protein [Sphingobacterium sp. FBM7-1]MDY0370269.1 DUF6448 family protein [Bacteroidales bacterium]HTM90992.1 DUF6448 family protein [Flavisolibacter sp.]